MADTLSLVAGQTQHEDSLQPTIGLTILQVRLQLRAPSSPSDVSPAFRLFSLCSPPCCVRGMRGKKEIHSALLLWRQTVVVRREMIETFLPLVSHDDWLYYLHDKGAAIVGFVVLRSL